MGLHGFHGGVVELLRLVNGTAYRKMLASFSLELSYGILEFPVYNFRVLGFLQGLGFRNWKLLIHGLGPRVRATVQCLG